MLRSEILVVRCFLGAAVIYTAVIYAAVIYTAVRTNPDSFILYSSQGRKRNKNLKY